MELLFVAIILGFICALVVIGIALFSKQKGRTVYVPMAQSNRSKTKGSIKNCDIEGFLK